MVVVCCKWSCIVRKAFVTRCRKPALGSARGLSPRSRRIPSKHCSTLLPLGGFPATGRGWKSCCCPRSLGARRRANPRSREKRRQECRRDSWMKGLQDFGPCRSGCRSGRPALRQSSHFEGLFPLSFFLTLISLLYRLAMSLLALPTDQLVFVKLNVSMPCDTPRWRLLVSCPCLPFIFRSQTSVPGNAPVWCFLCCLHEPQPTGSPIWPHDPLGPVRLCGHNGSLTENELMPSEACQTSLAEGSL